MLLSIEKLHGEEQHHCIWYKTCGQVEGKTVNCAYNGSGQLITDKESQQIMYKLCPELYRNRKLFCAINANGFTHNKVMVHLFIAADDKVCCDDEMISIMSESVQIASIFFGRCSTCMKNFRKSVCAMNCSPEQSRFLTPEIKTKPNDGNDTRIPYEILFGLI